MKYFFNIIFFVFASGAVLGQNPDRKFISHKMTGNKIEVTVSDGIYNILFYNNNIVETTFIPTGESHNPESHAVVIRPLDMTLGKTENEKVIEYGTPGLAIQIEKSPFRINYFYREKLLLSEKNGYTKRDSSETIDFNINATEALFGGGARAVGMNRRGNRLQLYNRAHYGYGDRSELLNFTIPMVLSSKIYAVHFDNAPIGYLDLDSRKDNTITYETISGRKTYQVIAGRDWDQLTENYTLLTGRQPLPPRWTFGNFSSRFGYHSQKETEAVIDKFRQEKIPVDAIVLDLYWFGTGMKGTMGNFEWLKDSFPDPKAMIGRLASKNVKTVVITEPFVLTTSNKWKDAAAKNVLATSADGKPFTYDFYFGNTGLIDIFKPEAKTWFWDIYKDLINIGVAGMWGDLGEPEVFPSEAFTVKGSADEVHNIYGHNWAKLVFEGYKKDFPTVRPFILMRAGYSGSQRFGMIPWSGDVGRSWGGLKAQPEIALQMGMQGLSYMHSDLGGFAGDNTDNELYTRWLQYGVFQPVFRPHAGEAVPPEAVFREEKTKALAKKSIELRYQLLPYNYTLAFKNSQTGTPLMRPVFFEEPENEALYGRSDEYLWGDAFLVAPVVEQGIKMRDVYFPKSANWFELGIKKYKAGGRHTVPVKEDEIPYFVRGGAFIPMVLDNIQSTEELAGKKLVVRYIHDSDVKESTGMYYDDDGKTRDAFTKGNYEILKFKSKIKGRKLLLTVTSEPGENYKGEEREILYEVYDMNKKALYPITLKSGKSKIISLNIK